MSKVARSANVIENSATNTAAASLSVRIRCFSDNDGKRWEKGQAKRAHHRDNGDNNIISGGSTYPAV